MLLKIVNAFAEAAQEVLLAEAALTAHRGEVALVQQPYITQEVTVLISLVGDLRGTVVYSLSQAAALALAAQMLGEPLEHFDGLAQSGIAELGNVITGQAASRLAGQGYHFSISPPSLILGHNVTLSTLDLPQIAIPLATEIGPLLLHLAVRSADGWVPGTGSLSRPSP